MLDKARTIRASQRQPTSEHSDDDAALELVVREYLAMRVELNDAVRLELQLILGAVAVLGGAVGAVAADVGNVGTDGQSLFLLGGAGFAFVILSAAISIANGFLVLEEYVTAAGRELEQAFSARTLRNAFTFQSRVRAFTRSPRPLDVVANLAAYGTPAAVAASVLVFAAGLAWSGYELRAGGGGGPWRVPFALIDAALGAVTAALLVTSVWLRNRWKTVLRYE